MKRYGGLFDSVISFENLHSAFRLAARGKREQPEVVRWRYHLETRLLKLRDRLVAGDYEFGPYRSFMVLDPKPRNIVAAPFEDRIVHHAMCNVLVPVFEKSFIFDSYACRDGKGTHPAVFRLQEFMRGTPGGHVLQCDVRKYFQSVDHAVLKRLIRRKVKDCSLLQLVDAVIDSSPVHPDVEPGRGLPIGNLTSQLFANVYLDPLDHFVKELLRGQHYVRYVDDWVVVDQDKSRLHEMKGRIGLFLADVLQLDLHPNKSHVVPCRSGVTFLGYRVWPNRLRVKTATMVRIRRKEKALRKGYWQGTVTAEEYRQTVASLLGHIKWGDRTGAVTKQLLS